MTLDKLRTYLRQTKDNVKIFRTPELLSYWDEHD